MNGEKIFYFLSEEGQMALPVTPRRYTWAKGKNVETVNISAIGDVSLAGKPTRYAGRIECMFPANPYAWLTPGASTDPYWYVSRFSQWAREETAVRFIVGGTDINAQVLIEEIQYEEQDGSGDVYARIELKEWVDIEAVTVSSSDTSVTKNKGQSQGGGREQYTIVSGDMLSVLCRRFYGSGTAAYYNALARYNGIANPHLIYPGTTITIPPAAELLGG